ncbi:MAG: RIP metalloprotease RseP [Pseudomonadota bacterium]
MQFIAEIPLLGTFLPFLIVLGVVVFVHEYGHYIVGRWCGIKAEVFSIGFGKELFHWHDKRGMRWRVGILPLGGYVKFAGDMNAASAGVDADALANMTPEERAGAFHLAPIWKRALTILAGPFANFILAICVFAAVAMWQGRDVNEPVIGSVKADAAADLGFQAGDRVVAIDGKYVEDFNAILAVLAEVEDKRTTAIVNRGGGEVEIDIFYQNPAKIDQVLPGGASAYAGIKSGDVITAINGEPMPSFNSVREAVTASGGETLVITVDRGGEALDFDVTPIMISGEDEDGNPTQRPLIGVTNASYGGIEPRVEAAGIGEALDFGVERSWLIVTATLNFIYDAFAGRADLSQLGGPIQIATVSHQAAEQGSESLINMIAFVSVAIGLFNLFPIPVLDGGHLLFYAVEAIRGKPLRERWQEYGNGLGLSLILLLMVFATYNDILRF